MRFKTPAQRLLKREIKLLIKLYRISSCVLPVSVCYLAEWHGNTRGNALFGVVDRCCTAALDTPQYAPGIALALCVCLCVCLCVFRGSRWVANWFLNFNKTIFYLFKISDISQRVLRVPLCDSCRLGAVRFCEGCFLDLEKQRHLSVRARCAFYESCRPRARCAFLYTHFPPCTR